MHHQVQQFSDIRLKSLALTRCVRHCHVAFVPVAIAFHEIAGPRANHIALVPRAPRSADIASVPCGCKAFALSLFYSQNVQEFAAGQAGPNMCWRNFEPVKPVLIRCSRSSQRSELPVR
jgi:hypothetical protein